MTTNTTEDEMRDAFESATNLPKERIGDGDYSFVGTHCAWGTWQARESEMQQLRDKLARTEALLVAREAQLAEIWGAAKGMRLPYITAAARAEPLIALASHDAKVKEMALRAVTTELVTEILNSYHCIHYANEDGGLPLVDSLTPRCDQDITRGKEELESLADYIAGELADAIRDGKGAT